MSKARALSSLAPATLTFHGTGKTILLLGMLLLLLAAGGLWAEPPPKLWFQKQLQKESKNQAPKVYRYRVRKGEYIYSILREMGLKEKELPRVMQEVKDLNPHIQNFNRIQPGQEIKLPARLGPEQPQVLEYKQGAEVSARQIPTRAYQVQKGEHLVQILRQELNLPDELIFDEYLNLVLDLNPDLDNPNLLQSGDRLRLPLLKDKAETGSSKQDPAGLQEPQKKPGQDQTATADSDRQESQTDPRRKTLLSLLRLLGFRFASGQEMFMPLPDGGWLQLNLEQSALAKTPWDFNILFVPEDKSSLLQQQGLQELDLRLCPAENWSLGKVLQNLQGITQRRLLLWPQEKELILSGEHRVLELKAEMILVQKLQDTRKYHLLHTGQEQSPGIPDLLLGYLQSQDIYYHNLDSDSEHRFVTLGSTQAKDLSVPRLQDLKPFAQAMHRPRRPQEKSKEYLKRVLQDQATVQEKTIHLGWGRSLGPEISLTLRLLQLKTAENSFLVLPSEQQNPYLLALLRQAGHDCFVF
ncbi:MAG: LysM peptidoglycan-binding domain-containing protein [Desulfohalobiaceae bacterium]